MTIEKVPDSERKEKRQKFISAIERQKCIHCDIIFQLENSDDIKINSENIVELKCPWCFRVNFAGFEMEIF